MYVITTGHLIRTELFGRRGGLIEGDYYNVKSRGSRFTVEPWNLGNAGGQGQNDLKTERGRGLHSHTANSGLDGQGFRCPVSNRFVTRKKWRKETFSGFLSDSMYLARACKCGVNSYL